MRAICCVALGLTLAGCQKKPAADAEARAAASASKPPLDHLAPSELAQGTAEVWGFPVPREMRVERRYTDAAHIVGPVTPEAVANYVRDRVLVSHVEIGAGRTVFPNARIKGGPANHVYQLEVVPEPSQTRLLVRDVTPIPAVQGLSNEERWRQAGLRPDGKFLDPKKFE